MHRYFVLLLILVLLQPVQSAWWQRKKALPENTSNTNLIQEEEAHSHHSDADSIESKSHRSSRALLWLERFKKSVKKELVEPISSVISTAQCHSKLIVTKDDEYEAMTVTANQLLDVSWYSHPIDRKKSSLSQGRLVWYIVNDTLSDPVRDIADLPYWKIAQEFVSLNENSMISIPVPNSDPGPDNHLVLVLQMYSSVEPVIDHDKVVFCDAFTFQWIPEWTVQRLRVTLPTPAMLVYAKRSQIMVNWQCDQCSRNSSSMNFPAIKTLTIHGKKFTGSKEVTVTHSVPVHLCSQQAVIGLPLPLFINVSVIAVRLNYQARAWMPLSTSLQSPLLGLPLVEYISGKELIFNWQSKFFFSAYPLWLTSSLQMGDYQNGTFVPISTQSKRFDLRVKATDSWPIHVKSNEQYFMFHASVTFATNEKNIHLPSFTGSQVEMEFLIQNHEFTILNSEIGW